MPRKAAFAPDAAQPSNERSTAARGLRGDPGAIRALAQRWLDAATLRAHALADRWEQLPASFGEAGPVSPTDPAALRREWLRVLRSWASDSPEQLFAIKAGVLMLAGALALLLVVVAAL